MTFVQVFTNREVANITDIATRSYSAIILYFIYFFDC